MKLGSTTIFHRQNRSQNNGNMLCHHYQRKQIQYSWTEMVMASVSWDAKGILLIDYLPTGQYYAQPPRPTTGKDIWKKVGFGKEKCHLSWGHCLHAHKCYCHGKIHELRYELLSYSPDLAPSNFHLFSKLKIFLSGRRFSTRTERYFAGLEESHFWDGIEALEHRWTKCVSLGRLCLKKKNQFHRGKTLLFSTYREISNHLHITNWLIIQVELT